MHWVLPLEATKASSRTDSIWMTMMIRGLLTLSAVRKQPAPPFLLQQQIRNKITASHLALPLTHQFPYSLEQADQTYLLHTRIPRTRDILIEVPMPPQGLLYQDRRLRGVTTQAANSGCRIMQAQLSDNRTTQAPGNAVPAMTIRPTLVP